MPLVWAHAEFVKLASSRELGRPCDRPEAVWQRYGGIRPAVGRVVWTPRFPVTELSAGIALRICLPEPANVHFGTNGWKDVQDSPTRASGLGVHVADLPVARLGPGDRIDFTFFWPVSSQWEDRDYTVAVV